MLHGINGHKDPFALVLPSLLDIGVMGHCINSCPWCYQGKVDQPHMTLLDFMSIIDQVYHHTNQIALGGRGDPNKHPDFVGILEYCRKHNIVPNYTTSGIDLTDDEIEASKMCGAVAVSDYEQPHTYDALKRLMDANIKTNIHQIFHRGTFDKCLKTIQGYNPWQTQDQESKVDIERLNAVIFLLFKPQGSGQAMPELIPTKRQMAIISEKIFNPDCSFKIGIDSCLANHVLHHIRPTPMQMMSIDTCEAARMSGYITPNMKFKPCSFAERSSEVLLTDRNLDIIWNDSTPFKTFRNILTENRAGCPIGF